MTGSAGNYSVTARHTFTGAGPYTVRVTVTDPAAKTGSATTTILVPSSVSALSIPGRISARALLCGVKRHSKCTGLAILGSFRSGGGALWDVSISKSGRGSMVLGQITRKVTAGSVKLVFKVTNRPLAKRLYRMVKRHKLNRLSVQQVFTNAAGARSQTTLFSRVTK
jgi:PKD repeat protein